ncbi:MAG: DM13 domain-containing protein [bacterium]|nr:DM13 domain-containing protein [bacterium]
MKRAIESVRRRPLLSGAVAVAVGAIGVWLIFGFFGFQTLFFDDEVSEANPFAAGAAPSGLAVDETTQEMADAMNEAMEDDCITGDAVVDEETPEEVDAAPEVTILAQGSFIDRSHPTSGIAKIITDGNRRFLRFENFETDNGPDLDVYLATGSPDGDLGEAHQPGRAQGQRWRSELRADRRHRPGQVHDRVRLVHPVRSCLRGGGAGRRAAGSLIGGGKHRTERPVPKRQDRQPRKFPSRRPPPGGTAASLVLLLDQPLQR